MTAVAIVTPRASTFGIAALSRAFTARFRAQRAERRKEVELLLAVERMAALSPHLLDDIGIGAAAGMEMPSSRA